MAPRMDGNSKKDENAVPNAPVSFATGNVAGSTVNLSRASSQAEAVASQLEASQHANGTKSDGAIAFVPPSTPPVKVNRKAEPVRQESALKRLGRSLRIRSRRALSAPPTLRRRRNRPLIEEHFRVEREENADKNMVILPGVLAHEDNWARDLHDFFNLVVLVPVVALNMMNWSWDLLLNEPEKLNSLGDAWTGEYYYAFFYSTLLYFVADLLWMGIAPHCVRSPMVIIQHHVATILYILVPHSIPHVRWCMGACMSVEINTWLLIARRVFNKQGFPPWIIDLSFVSLRIKMISMLFYITWIGIRCILYPLMMIDIIKLYQQYSVTQGSYWNLLLVCFPLHGVFCMLNLKWSYDLLMSKIRYWKRRGAYDAEDAEKEKGL